MMCFGAGDCARTYGGELNITKRAEQQTNKNTGPVHKF